MFSRRHNNSTSPPDTTPRSSTTTRSRGGLFNRRRTSSYSSSDDEHHRRRRGTTGAAVGAGAGTAVGGGLFGGRTHDKSLISARDKVNWAERAEREADSALANARSAVQDARRHLQVLEAEANEQARLAQEKVLATRSLKNNAKGLGRFN